MSDSDSANERGSPQEGPWGPTDKTGYPTNHVVAILDQPGEVTSAIDALTQGGFLTSEAQVLCGSAAADSLHATTGRSGLTNLVIRIAESIGVMDFEMEVKARAEQALRDGRYVISVAAPTDERKDVAVRILREHRAHSISYHGRFTIQDILPPRTS